MTSLALTLDESNDNDFQVDKDGVRYLVEKSILARAVTITVDFEEEGAGGPGFAIIAERPMSGGC